VRIRLGLLQLSDRIGVSFGAQGVLRRLEGHGKSGRRVGHIGVGPVRFEERDVETESRFVNCDTARRKGRLRLRRAYDHRATSGLN
jgi:hypothetical protein